ncbi:MAG: hypothetical protein MI974_25440 [Chitinophagales bacterium]|nr:hypothetical protein [Chitinophagales bacterium]
MRKIILLSTLFLSTTILIGQEGYLMKQAPMWRVITKGSFVGNTAAQFDLYVNYKNLKLYEKNFAGQPNSEQETWFKKLNKEFGENAKFCEYTLNGVTYVRARCLIDINNYSEKKWVEEILKDKTNNYLPINPSDKEIRKVLSIIKRKLSEDQDFRKKELELIVSDSALFKIITKQLEKDYRMRKRRRRS